MRSPWCVCVSVLSLFVSIAFAGDPHAGHDHGAPDLGNVGNVTFPTSCNEVAQKEINRGVALIHSFWYAESEAAFRQAAAADPKCGMAWWGVAMSNYHPIWAPPTPDELKRGTAAALEARNIGAGSDRERMYIEAVNSFYADSETVPHPARAAAFDVAMARVAARYPDDDEAAIFHALALLSTAPPTDKTYAHQKEAAEILNRELARHPAHPGIAHYIIHSFDYPELAPLALSAARSYAKLAPGSPHALHMPSHIFTRLGLWDESIASNLASSERARSYVAQKGAGLTSFDDLHAIDYLVYAYLQERRLDAAKKLVERTAAVRQLNDATFAAAFAIAAVPARWTLERHAWNEAAALPSLPSIVPWEKYSYAEANLHFARALGAARSGQTAVAERELARLDSIRQLLRDQKDDYWSGQVEIQRLDAAAWLARAQKKPDDALKLARQAADLEDSTAKHPVTPGAILPARELLAEMLLESGRPRDALAEAERTLKNSPNRYNALSIAATAAKRAGEKTLAAQYEQKLKALVRS